MSVEVGDVTDQGLCPKETILNSVNGLFINRSHVSACKYADVPVHCAAGVQQLLLMSPVHLMNMLMCLSTAVLVCSNATDEPVCCVAGCVSL